MRTQIVLVALVLVLTALFTALNWTALTASTPINLLVVDVQGPLGLVVLLLAGVLIALMILLVVWMQASVLLEARRHSRELNAQRELADKAEASRFTELREMLKGELASLAGEGRPTVEVLARLDQLEDVLRKEVHDSGNTLAAYIGELENRLENNQNIRSDDPNG